MRFVYINFYFDQTVYPFKCHLYIRWKNIYIRKYLLTAGLQYGGLGKAT